MRRAAICLLSGTVLTVATAILAALRAPLHKQPSILLDDDHAIAALESRAPFQTRVRRARENLGYWDLTVEQWRGWGCELTVINSSPVMDVIAGSIASTSDPAELRTGWPFLSFSAAPGLFRTDQRSSWSQGLLVSKPWVRNLPPNSTAFANATTLAIGPFPTTIVPLKPEVLPLLGNIVFWGGLSYLFMYFPFDARRIIRRSRGMCTQCGYPVRGLPNCPECGPEPQASASGPHSVRSKLGADDRPLLQSSLESRQTGTLPP